jgi:hypothetical protein
MVVAMAGGLLLPVDSSLVLAHERKAPGSPASGLAAPLQAF